ncbi:MAG: mannitol dehydrogenase family protein [Clostridia bacterium]|nr:mannitol dehydrogenase family protein [Clostridia bacterium]
MRLTFQGLTEKKAYRAAGVSLPAFDIDAMRKRTAAAPRWLHFGAGNIFRAFPCTVMQRLLEQGITDTGIIACETYDPAIIRDILAPHNNLSLLVTLMADGRTTKTVVASIADAIAGDHRSGIDRIRTLFSEPTLQMVSLTVTEKAYRSENPLMRQLADLLRERYTASGLPLALVSMDNCAHNGDKLREAILPAVDEIIRSGAAPDAFRHYATEHVTYPITMIDKITPHPDEAIAGMLRGLGMEDLDIVRTAKGTVSAGFVNAEEVQYLVIEDAFPNGKPPLDRAGVIFTDRATVDKVEKMKVGTCLNPLHTALALLGSLLSFTRIYAAVEDPDIKRFVEILGFEESLPVVQDPGVISPRAFLTEVLTRRVNNPFLPDTPQRIATDTSQKLPVRFSWTMNATADKRSLRCVPFVFAAWLRYLTGIDDQGNIFTPSSDPRLDEVRARMAAGLSDELLGDQSLFGADLIKNGVAEPVRRWFSIMMEGKGAVRRALRQVIGNA